MFKRGDEFLTKQMKGSGSETVEYVTGADRRTVLSQLAITSYELADESGMLIKTEVRDFIIEASALSGEPKRSDWIYYNGDKYIVMPLMSGADAFKYTDAFKKKYRIHTKK